MVRVFESDQRRMEIIIAPKRRRFDDFKKGIDVVWLRIPATSRAII